MVVMVIRGKFLPDVVGADDDDTSGRCFLLGGVVEESQFTSIQVA
jgi:hypothetical protein